MKIYTIDGIDGFEELQLADYDKDVSYIELLCNPDSILDKWKKVEFKVVTKGKKSDFPYSWAGRGIVIISEKAKDVLKPLLQEKVEFLPVSCEGINYYLVHVMQVSDINYEYILKIGNKKIRFDREQVLNSNIQQKVFFRGYLQGDKLSEMTFCTEKLIEIVKQNNLRGFDYIEVWNSEDN